MGDEDEEEARLKSPLEEEDPALQGPSLQMARLFFFPAAAAIPSSFFFPVRMIFDRCCMRGPRLGAFCRVLPLLEPL